MSADLKRVFVLRAEDASAGEALRLPEHTAVLDDALARTRARLLVIDPVVAFLDPRIQSSNDASVRRSRWNCRMIKPAQRIVESPAYLPSEALPTRSLHDSRSQEA